MRPVDPAEQGWLPPGQSATRRFPVVGEAAPPGEALNLESWRLAVDGAVSRPIELRYGELLAGPQRELTFDVHCVTGWSRRSTTFTGLPLREVVELAGGPTADARFARFEAYSARAHDTSLPLGLAL